MYSPVPDVDLPLQEQPPPSSTEKRRLSVNNFQWRAFLILFALSCNLFGVYMTCFFLRSMVQNHMDAWDLVNPGMFHEGRWDSNYFGLGLHFWGAAYAMLFGPLQFVPTIRQHYISFHRWNGRLSALSILFASLGGIYYICAVGVTSAKLEGQQANISSFVFGLFMLVSGVQTYRHASWTKKIDQHKLWAYRVAGLCLGNIFGRIYLLIAFMFWGEDPGALSLSAAVLGYIFFFPFFLLAGVVWRREQEADEKRAVPSVFLITVSSFLLLSFLLGVVLVFLFFWLPFITIGSLDNQDQEDL